MEPLLVVDTIQELANLVLRVCQIPILTAVDLFVFESLHERLTSGVVVGIALAAHANLGPVLLEEVRVIHGGVLHAAIRVVHEPGSWLALFQCIA